MAQAARDPLFWATMTIAEQDAPASGDLCLRCHTPKGWLEGRSTPTDGSALLDADRDGVTCHFCHKSVKPTAPGVNPYSGDADYTSGTYPADQLYIGSMTDPVAVSANGMYIVDSIDYRRGPYVDAEPPHNFYYSPFHRDASICGTCHDVSNPAFTKDGSGKYVPNDFDTPPPDSNPYSMFPVERTFSEWKYSAYNTSSGVYAPQFGGNRDTVRTCQDCHMRDVTGKGAKGGTPVRSDLGLHDMTGGNTFIPNIINLAFPDDNVDQESLDSGVVRATRMLELASTMSGSTSAQESQHLLNVHIVNETGHKLPSGYPEGRRIWINVRAWDTGDNLVYESGAYNSATGELSHDAEVKIYQIKPGISATLSGTVSLPAEPSFHFVLNDTIYSDNRIPPRGFTNANYEMIQSPPVGYSYPDGQYWDDTEYLIPGSADSVHVTLYYQTTSKEYVEFLRDENVTDTLGQLMYDLWSANGKSAPVVMNEVSLSLTPLAVNNPPVLDSIGEQSTDEGVLLSFEVTASDPDGTTPALSAAQLPGDASFTDHNDGSGTFEWTPAIGEAGSYEVIFIATDASAAADSQRVTVDVLAINVAPALAAIDDHSVPEGNTLSFDLSATDGNNDSLWFTASPLPPNASLTDHGDGTAAFSFSPGYDQASVYEIVFAVHDGEFSDEDTSVITVTNTNRAPLLGSINDTSVHAGDNLSLDISASDPDGESVDLTTEPLPTGASFTDHSDGTGTLEWAPTADQAGLWSITFYASDGSLEDTAYITVTVTSTGCCIGNTGNVDYDESDGVDISDLTKLVNNLFVTFEPIPCFAEANTTGDAECTVDISDLTRLVNYLFVTFEELAPCDPACELTPVK
jgi:hypothetical protein